MRPQVFHGHMTPLEDGGLVEGGYFSERDHGPAAGPDEFGWFCRLSAPGYMDCTEWSGPFDTEDEAREHLAETYDIDPYTGEEASE